MDDNNVYEFKFRLFDFITTKSFQREAYTISPAALDRAFKKCKYVPRSPCLYRPLADALNNNFDNLNEACMFLSHVLHRTKGLKFHEDPLYEIDRQTVQHKYSGPLGYPNKSYHGRGYLMIKHPDNYLRLSVAMGMGDRLLRDPDLIIKDKQLCLSTAVCYWRLIIRRMRNMCDRSFWMSADGVFNIDKEEPSSQVRKETYNLYFKVATLFEVRDVLIETKLYYKP
ncbi:hypothetical protein COBT_001369, partial [Conglomerata obtusa]